MALLLLAPQEPLNYSVFVLAGQSNMEGQAVVDLDHEEYYNGGRGILARLYEDPALAERLAHLKDGDEWASRDDVLVWYRRRDEAQLVQGPLSIGFGAYDGRHHFGPELQFGHLVGDHFEEPVLLVKACWGGKSLQADFRPPGVEGETGAYFTKILEEVRLALDAAPEHMPALRGRRPALRGLVWFQGWNDMVSDEATAEYSNNLRHLIQDLRTGLDAARLPVVVGETGNAGKEAFRTAQRLATEHPPFEGNVVFVPTRAFLRAPEDSPNSGHGHHWFGNAESVFLIGDAFGRAMLGLLDD